tara:strand:- start:139 stop:483 length:345 start_codon:yes stop_codon:yes gene_type:complete
MAHFVKIVDNIVTNAVVVHNNELLVDGVEVEAKGAEFCTNLFGGTWIQTSFNNRIRKQFAGVGYAYDSTADVFIAPKPFASWTLDSNHDWQAPTPKPDGEYLWNESQLQWVLIQ